MHSFIALFLFAGGAVAAGWTLRDALLPNLDRINAALNGAASTLFAQENRR